MTEIFEITGADRREELLQALKDDEPFTTQATGGKDIETFEKKYGFVLLRKDKTYPPTNKSLLRVNAVLNIYGLLGRSSLRTGYYTCRQKPEYAQYFEDTGNFNGTWLDTVSRHLEIFCDIDRDVLTFGTPDGVIFYPYSRRYGSEETMIALSEDIATEYLKDDDIKYCMNILINEKMANALELIGDNHDFLKMLNMVCATRGGRFNRAILKLIHRFDEQKNVLLWTDADVFGCDIRAVAFRGSKNLRHATLSQTSRHAFDVGLFPSVAEMLNVPVDIDEKKPMSGDPKTGARKMVEHLKNAGLNPMDLQTFYNDKTYEIEGLHAKFTDKKGKPIGTQIYLVEYLRHMGLNAKPQPPEDNDELKTELYNSLCDLTEDRVRAQVQDQINLAINTKPLDEVLDEFRDRTVDEIGSQQCRKINELIDLLPADEIRKKITDWYVRHPVREMYDMMDIAKEMLVDVQIDVTLDLTELQNRIDDTINDIAVIAHAQLNDATVDSSVQLQEFEKIEVVKDYYDMVLRRLGASKDDVLKIREALQRRLAE